MAFFAPFFLSLTIAAALLSPATAHRYDALPPSSPSPLPALTAAAAADEDPFTYVIPIVDQTETDDNRYLTARMMAAVKKVENFVADGMGGKLKTAVEEGKYDVACMAMCKEMYENAAEEMKKGVESVTSGDFIKAAFDVSAFNTDVDACNECSDAFGEFDKWAKRVAGDCLDKIIRHTAPHF